MAPTDEHRRQDQGRRQKPAAVKELPRVPPHNLDAEQSLLGALLLSNEAAKIVDRLAPGDFYRPAHGTVFAAMAALAARGEGLDPVTVAEELRLQGALDDVGGTAAIVAFQADTPRITQAAVEEYADIILRARRARDLGHISDNLGEAAHVGDLERAAVVLDDALRVVATAASERDLALEDVGAVMRGEVPPIVPTMLRRDDGVSLIYPGLLHWIMGEHSLGKSFIALAACAQILTTELQPDLFGAANVVDPTPGPAVLYLDWEGNRRIVGSRLLAMGVPVEAVEARFLYYRPPTLSRTSVARMVATARDRGVVLAVVDGVGKAHARQGLDDERNPEVYQWMALVCSPLTEAGIAVLCLDHVVKDKEARGRHARGGSAKIDGVDGAAWQAVRHEAFSRHKAGATNLVQKKEREGMVTEDEKVAAVIRFEPLDGGERLRVSVLAPTDVASVPFRPTHVMAAVSAELARADGPIAKRTLRGLIHGKSSTIDAAIARLEAEGFITCGTKGCSHVRPFVEDQPEPESSPEDPEEEGSWDF